MNARTINLIEKAETLGFCTDIDVLRFKARRITETELQGVLEDLLCEGD